MIPALTILDNFLPAGTWGYVRNLAKAAHYHTVDHRDGHSYANIGRTPGDFSIGNVLEMALGAPLEQHLQYFRLGKPGDGAGNIHIDNGEGVFASVYYLNSQEEIPEDHPYGTAFWSHKWMASRCVPPGDQEDLALVDLLNADRVNPDKWRLEMVVPAVPNRLIVYPTNYFHSRWPLEPVAGRLIHCAFWSPRHVASQ